MKENFINHGQKEIEQNSYWLIENGDIILTLGEITFDSLTAKINVVTLQVNSPEGPIIETRQNHDGTLAGQTIKVITEDRIVVGTVIKVNPESAIIFLTENKRNNDL